MFHSTGIIPISRETFSGKLFGASDALDGKLGPFGQGITHLFIAIVIPFAATADLTVTLLTIGVMCHFGTKQHLQHMAVSLVVPSAALLL